MSDVGNVGDRWIWRGSVSTKSPSLPPPTPPLSPVSTYLPPHSPYPRPSIPPTPTPASQVTSQATPLTVITSESLHGLETLPSAFPTFHVTYASSHPTTSPRWVWGTELVVTQSSGGWGTGKATFPPSLKTTELPLINATLLRGVINSATWLETFPTHTTATVTEGRTASHLYTRSTEVYGIHSSANTQATAGELQVELSLPFSYFVLSVLVISLLVSLVANLVMLFTILRRSYLRQTIFVLYLNLAASNLLASVLTVPVVTLVFFCGGGEERRGGAAPSVGTCSLLSAGLVLLCYVSVGSIIGICTVRWCQYCSFSKTRVQEKLIIRFFILFLWASGFGITGVLVFRHAVGNSEVKCTPLHLAKILNDALPFSSTCIILGLILVILVNSLTIRKLSKIDTCLPPRQERPVIRRYLTWLPQCTASIGSPQNIATSEQSSLNEYPKLTSEDLIGGAFQGQSFNMDKNKGTHPETKDSPIPHVKSDAMEAEFYGTCTENLNSVSRDLSIGLPSRSCVISSSQLPPLSAPQPLPPLLQETDDINEGKEKGPPVLRHIKTEPTDNAPPNDLESEHLYEVIEPCDVQEEVATPAGRNPQEKEQVPRHRVLLPNVIEIIYDGSPQVKLHQTTLANTAAAPDPDHSINTKAWSIGGATDPVGGDAVIAKVAEDVTQEGTAEEEEKVPATVAEASHTNKTTSGLLHSAQSSPSIGEAPLSPRSWLPLLPATTSSIPDGKPCRHAHRLGKRAALRAAVEESPSAGYLADLSAPSSKPGTPHLKMGRRQRAERIMNLSRTRVASKENDSEDEEPKESRPSPAPTSARVRSCRNKPPSQGPPGTLTDAISENKIPPVHMKCVRISHCLSAMFVLAYLPLLLMQVLLRVLGGSTTLVVTLTYMSLLLAIHPTLYGYQSPILRNAMRKVAKRPRTSLPSQDSDPRP